MARFALVAIFLIYTIQQYNTVDANLPAEEIMELLNEVERKITHIRELFIKDAVVAHPARHYFFSTIKRTWTDADDACKNIGGELTSIDSKSENLFLKTEIIKRKMSVSWIGLNDRPPNAEGNFSWSDGSKLTYQNWIPKQPDGGKTNNCGYLHPSNGGWYDSICLSKLAYICKIESHY